MARAYRKKPVVVEAVQWTGENHAEMCEFIDPEVFEIIPRVGLVIHTLEGDHHASPGDYIIKGVNGEFYPCKPDIFAKTYESAALTPPNEPRAGLYGKYTVYKNKDGSLVTDCFILRPAKDPAAVAALRVYAAATDNAELAADIINWVGAEPNEWVSVEERLPDKPGHYLVCTSINYWHGGCMDVNQEHKYHDNGTPVGYDGTTMSVLDCYYDITGDWNRVCNKHVTHWMHLPAPPGTSLSSG